MNLDDIRQEIDEIDRQLVELFVRRMECSCQVADYKRENGLPIYHAAREEAVLQKVEDAAGPYGAAARQLYSSIMELSRDLQQDRLGNDSELRNRIRCASTVLPDDREDVRIACFGLPGSYTHRAASLVFPLTKPVFYESFREVFTAIQSGEADFGVIPIENSSAGSVTEVYDLMLQYRFYIVAEKDIPVNHCLAALPGTDITNVRKVCSHPQALSQCSDYVRAAKLEPEYCESTSAAAKFVADSGNHTIAAICSEDAAKGYGLTVIKRGFQNNLNNTTRFIVISRELIITPDADKISLCFSLPHTTGSLYGLLRRFAARGLNLTKLESRPRSDTPFEYLFYLDFMGHARDKEALSLLCALSEELPDFSFLGNSAGTLQE